MSKLSVLNPFTIDPDSHSSDHSISFPDPSLTVQSDAAQADINYIVKQFGLTHELPYGLAVPEYADYSDIPNDYHAAMSFVKDADDTFLTMSADVRSRFKNDAGLFLDFLSDASNHDEAVSLGLVPRTEPPIPTDGLPISAVPLVDPAV